MTRKTFLSATGVVLGGSALAAPLAAARPRSTSPHPSGPRPTPDGVHLDAKVVPAAGGRTLDILGSAHRFTLEAADTYGHLAEWGCVAPPGAGVPPHFHTREDEVFRVHDGRLDLQVDGVTTVLHPGDTAFAPRNLVHAWFNTSEAPVRFTTSAFPAGMERMLAELAELPAGPPDLARVGEVCARYGIHFV